MRKHKNKLELNFNYIIYYCNKRLAVVNKRNHDITAEIYK